MASAAAKFEAATTVAAGLAKKAEKAKTEIAIAAAAWQAQHHDGVAAATSAAAVKAAKAAAAAACADADAAAAKAETATADLLAAETQHAELQKQHSWKQQLVMQGLTVKLEDKEKVAANQVRLCLSQTSGRLADANLHGRTTIPLMTIRTLQCITVFRCHSSMRLTWLEVLS